VWFYLRHIASPRKPYGLLYRGLSTSPTARTLGEIQIIILIINIILNNWFNHYKNIKILDLEKLALNVPAVGDVASPL
jgi:hypothetical protein